MSGTQTCGFRLGIVSCPDARERLPSGRMYVRSNIRTTALMRLDLSSIRLIVESI